MSFIIGGYELFVPVITIFRAKAVNAGMPASLYCCSLKVSSSFAGGTAASGEPSVLKATQATSLSPADQQKVDRAAENSSTKK